MSLKDIPLRMKGSFVQNDFTYKGQQLQKMLSFLVTLNVEEEKCQKVIESERAGFNSSACH